MIAVQKKIISINYMKEVEGWNTEQLEVVTSMKKKVGITKYTFYY